MPGDYTGSSVISWDYERLERGMLGAERAETGMSALVRAVAEDAELHDHPL
jgi:hypothetical protein